MMLSLRRTTITIEKLFLVSPVVQIRTDPLIQKNRDALKCNCQCGISNLDLDLLLRRQQPRKVGATPKSWIYIV